MKPPKCYYDEEHDIVSWALEGFTAPDRDHLSALGPDGKPANRTFDCSLMELADDIAYGIHDIEDIVARRLADGDRVHEALVTAFESVGGCLDTADGKIDAAEIHSQLFASSFARKQVIGRVVNIFLSAACIIEIPAAVHPLLHYRVALPEQHRLLLGKLKKMAFKLVIDKAPVQQLEQRGKRVVEALFGAFMERPEQLIPSWDDAYDGETKVQRRVCDYVAGMTDSYAEKVYRRLFIPGFGSSSDEL